MNYLLYPKYSNIKHKNRKVSSAYIPIKGCKGTNIGGSSSVAFVTSCSRENILSKKLRINSRQATMSIINLIWFSGRKDKASIPSFQDDMNNEWHSHRSLCGEWLIFQLRKDKVILFILVFYKCINGRKFHSSFFSEECHVSSIA